MSRTLLMMLLFGVVLTFQNCSQMDFGGSGPVAFEKPADDQLVVDNPDDNTSDNPADNTTDNPTDDNDPNATPTPNPAASPTPNPSGSPTPSTPPGTDNPKKNGDNPPGGGNPPGSDSPAGSAGTCKQIDIAKVLINVNHIELQPAGIIVPVAADTVIDLMTLESAGITFGPLSTMSASSYSVHQVRLVLNDFGNKIVSTTDVEVALKTPSAQQSGLKFLLPSDITLEPGKSYLIQAKFDPASRIVRAGKKCILKPVIKVIAIQEAATAQ